MRNEPVGQQPHPVRRRGHGKGYTLGERRYSQDQGRPQRYDRDLARRQAVHGARTRRAHRQHVTRIRTRRQKPEDHAETVIRRQASPIEADYHPEPRQGEGHGDQLDGPRPLAEQRDAGGHHEEHLEIREQRGQPGTDVVDAAMPEPEVQREENGGAGKDHPDPPRQLQALTRQPEKQDERDTTDEHPVEAARRRRNADELHPDR